MNYNRDVYVAAEKIAEDSGGFFIPELGVVSVGERWSDRQNAMSPAAKVEMERRLAYYTEVMEPTYNPPKPGFIESITSLFFGTDELPRRAASTQTNNESTTADASEIQRRIEFFNKMRSRTVPFSSETQQGIGAEQ